MKMTKAQEKVAPEIHRAFVRFADARREFTLGEFEQYISEHMRELGGEGFVKSVGEAIVRSAGRAILEE